MSLTTGTRLGPYEIIAPLGAGGMGEVYRARDTKLGRDVAIKVLPASLSADGERLHRFEQEACAAGALNHPNILVIHHVDTHEGAPYIVSELLEGETLRQRMSGTVLAQRRAIDYASQIARGLAAAHEKGIVHRDLKPENIFITKDGRVKILDFGLAKLTQADGSQSQSEIPTRRVDTDPGVVMGTVGYMSPEQVRGKAVDHRSDIFSFGAILYEMLSGRRAFRGESAADTMSAILKEDPPDLSATNQNVSPALERLVNHCLEKNPEARFHSARDLAFALEALSGSTPLAQTAAMPISMLGRMGRRELISWGITAVAVLAAIVLLIAFSLRVPTDMRVSRVSVLPPEKASFRAIAVSPDGRRLAFSAIDSSGKTQLWVRPLDSLTAQALSGTEGAGWPFWSPDSRFIGFFAQGKLKKIAATGGPPQTLCNAGIARGGTWNSEDVIVFSPGLNVPLYRVPAAGGEPSQLTSLDGSRAETSHRWPYFLPDGRHFIYFSLAARTENRGIYVGSLDSKETKRLMSALEAAIYSAPGYLLFAREETTLMAQRFDIKKLQLIGDPFPVAQHVTSGLRAFEIYCSASDTGVLAYLSGGINNSQPVWIDRAGKQLGPIGPPGAYSHLSLSPDEKRVAFDSIDSGGNLDIWITDLARTTSSRFTFGSVNRDAVWSPDGSQIVFASAREGVYNLYLKPASGAGNEELLLKTDTAKHPTDWSRDGRFILYENFGASWDLWVLPLFGDRKPFPFVQTEATELQGRFSPEGHWIAYTSDEGAGTNQVYVQGFPTSGGKWQISRDGGTQPRWSRDGKELFYISADNKLMAVPVKADSSTFEPGVPQALFDVRIPANFAVTGDGQRFLINNVVEEAASSPATVVLNWTAALKK